MNKQNEEFELISAYTCDDAEDDGILVQTRTLLPGYPPHVVSHITTNLLMTERYFEQQDGRTDYRRANIIDLLNQAGPKIKKALEADPTEWLVTMKLENPNGQQYDAWAQKNEEHRYTLLMPEEY